MTAYLLIGASRGLGDALNRRLMAKGDTAWLVSRTTPALELNDGIERHWIPADLSEANAAAVIAQQLGDQAIDVLIYNAGIWEGTAFSSRYRFEDITQEEDERVLRVNLLSVLSCVKRLLPNLRSSTNPKLILIGSVSGMEVSRGGEVAYAASKFGLRGVSSALREGLREDRIGVTLINPGSFASRLNNNDAGLIPLEDLVESIHSVCSLSRNTCVRQIDLVAMNDPF
jgi:short-subunit dehydrogenase